MPRRNKLKVLPVGETCRNIPDLGRHQAMRWFLPLPEWPRQVHHKAKQKRLYYLVACGFPSLNHERARQLSLGEDRYLHPPSRFPSDLGNFCISYAYT